MKLSLAGAILIFHVTSILALERRGFWGNLWNETKNGVEDTYNKTKADVETSWDNIEKGVEDVGGDMWNFTKDKFESAVASKIADEIAGPKGVIAQYSLGYSEVPPIRSSLRKSKVETEITVGLYDPDSDNHYVQPKQFDFAQGRYNGWDLAWFGVAMDSFDAIVELDIDLSANPTGDLTLSLFKKSAGVDGVDVEIEFQIYMTAEAQAEMSFTTGLELTLNNPAAIMVPALDPIIDLKRAQNIGFQADDFTLTPIFNATMPKLEFSASVSLRTIFSVNVESVDVGALTLDLPAFDLDVKTLQNKMSNCKTPPPGTPPDHIYAELISLQANIDAKLGYEFLDDEFNGQIDQWKLFNLLDDCYAFFPGSGSIGPVPATSSDPILTAKAVDTCTSADGRIINLESAMLGLSTGEKVGIGFGCLLGVGTVAALAFVGGWASQRHRYKGRGTDGAEKKSRPWFGSFFGHGRRQGSSEYLFASQTPVRQLDNESGNLDIESGILISKTEGEVRSPDRNGNWTKRKPVPLAVPFAATFGTTDRTPSVRSLRTQPTADYYTRVSGEESDRFYRSVDTN